MNKKTAVVTLLLTWAAIGCATPPPPPTASCTFTVPLPPDPLPAGFDWTPLARDWCAQLAACGYPTQGCVQEYLDEIRGGPAAATAISGPTTGTEPVTEHGACEDSLEAQANPAICSPKIQQQRRSGERY